MSGITRNPKSDLITQVTERRTVFQRLALRRRSHEHPIAMFATIVAAAFVWILVPGEPVVRPAASAPIKTLDHTTTGKTSRLPMSAIDLACEGQAWGGESLDCVRMIARESGKADLKVRMIADAAPADLNTPNIF
ncbi:hypothetical protein SAZ10_07125 [Mesorhizobium sp. BAC0120]|uniref:hypothetical protein n=1 Tax=Mesorhizobium sp. BAC0120 TaxID=3090670 RepID=UPI00298D386E|nr:hypothetical protein [Mesorhizobium sp. BAC0120]MDW6021535.1 hypothetical protein [Mesorhizobium sp. BAC0120]